MYWATSINPPWNSRPLGLEVGFRHIVGFDTATIIRKALELIENTPKALENPFGDGYAASKIAKIVQGFLSHSSRIILCGSAFFVPIEIMEVLDSKENLHDVAVVLQLGVQELWLYQLSLLWGINQCA